MIKNANKISIIGGSGTGKTTLSENMAKELSLPVYHIDGMNYHKNWEARDTNQRDEMILEKVKEEKWIIDGTYKSTLKQRLENADLIIYLDYSSVAQVKGAMGRFIKNHGKEKPEIPGCNEKMSFQFFFWVLNWRKNKREAVVEAINQIDKNKVLIFKNRRQLNKWYMKEFCKKINTKIS